MNRPGNKIRLAIFLNVSIGIIFIVAAAIVVIAVNTSMHRQALLEAQSKARLILDRNIAIHTYFSHILKPSIFAWSEPFRKKEYFDPAWMSSTYAIREMEKFFKSLDPSGYSFKDAALNARSPENEADEYERAFLEKLKVDKKLESESTVRKIGGKPYLVVLRKGEILEASCLRCHSNPKEAPKGLTDSYGSERSFHRQTGDVISAVSLRIPLSEAYAAANIFSLKLSALLLTGLICLFIIQYWLYRRTLLQPLNVIQKKALQIATQEEHLGERIPQLFGRELNELSTAFNEMSFKLRQDRDHLEELVDNRTETLRREKEFSESLIETAQMIILVLDPEGKILRFNPYLEKISGYSIDEVIGKDWFETFLPERDRGDLRELFLKAVGDIQTRGNVSPIVTKGGEERTIEWYDKTIKNAQGSVIGLISIGQDITERRRGEEALLESKAQLSNALEMAHLGHWEYDVGQDLFTFNDQFYKIFRTTVEQVGGYTMSSAEYAHRFVHPDDMAVVGKETRKAIETTDPHFNRQIEHRILYADGTVGYITVRFFIVKGSHGITVKTYGVNQDITERKLAEEKIKASLLEKETMLKEIHHRVKNNLAVISSLLGLQSRYLEDEKSREIFRESQDRVRVMANIHTMLYQSKNLARVDFGGFIRDLAGRLQQSYRTAEFPIEIQVDIADVSLPIETSIPCGLILNELVSNALKHAFPEGRGGEIHIGLTTAGDQYVLTVQDNGIGFPEAVAFQNTKSLGLELVNLLVGQINGTIDLTVDGGTKFTITFPLANNKD
ncbi:MAG: DUF3365 domain-containing protein [Pseudomonadota bacterium]